MSNEYFAQKGDKYYIIDINTNEGYSFSDLGKGLEKLQAGYIVSICSVVRPVDVLSILSTANSNMCEIYYQEKRALISETGISVYAKIPKNYPKETIIPFRVVRDDCPGLTQILVPFKKGTVTNEMLGSVFGGVVWR